MIKLAKRNGVKGFYFAGGVDDAMKLITELAQDTYGFYRGYYTPEVKVEDSHRVVNEAIMIYNGKTAIVAELRVGRWFVVHRTEDGCIGGEMYTDDQLKAKFEVIN